MNHRNEQSPPPEGTTGRGFFARVADRIGNPLNWHAVSRCQFFTANALSFFSFSALLCHILLSRLDSIPYIDPDGLRLFRDLSVASAAAWLALGGSTLAFAKRYAKSSAILVHATIQLTAVSFALAAYLIGPYTSPITLIYMLFLVALVLFDWRAVTAGVVTAAAILFGTTIAEQLDILPSAPLFRAAPIEDGHVDLFWVVVSGSVTTFFISTALLIAGYIVARWRDREARYRELSTTDGLTRVTNRRHLMELFDIKFERARQHNTPIACIMIDIDHFKEVNDTHGHLLGDRVLVQVAAVLQDTVRASDVVGRYGGEEFAIVLPNTSMEGAVALAERCRTRIAEAAIALPDGALTVTASLGIAAFPDLDAEDFEALLRSADDALYNAKNAGRNRVIPASPVPT